MMAVNVAEIATKKTGKRGAAMMISNPAIEWGQCERMMDERTVATGTWVAMG